MYSDWVGMRPKTLRHPVIASTEDMRKAIEPSQHAPDLPTEEVTRPRHFEANAQADARDEEQRAARRRRIGAENELRQIMSNYPIYSILRGMESGEPWTIKQSDWPPDNYNVFWINVSAGYGGYTDWRPDGGPGLIERTGFDRALETEFGTARLANKEERRPANTALTRHERSKGGKATGSDTKAFYKFIEILEKRIGTAPTPRATITYFEGEGINKANPRDFHPEFNSAYLDVDNYVPAKSRIRWTDKKEGHYSRALDSMRNARKAMRSTER